MRGVCPKSGDASQAIQEGLLAARIQADPTYHNSLSIKELEDASHSFYSAQATVARFLSLAAMLTDGKVSGIFDKNSEEYIPLA